VAAYKGKCRTCWQLGSWQNRVSLEIHTVEARHAAGIRYGRLSSIVRRHTLWIRVKVKLQLENRDGFIIPFSSEAFDGCATN